jgi:hypothetical protein
MKDSKTKAFKAFCEDFKKDFTTTWSYKRYGHHAVQETMIVAPWRVKSSKIEDIVPPPLSISI